MQLILLRHAETEQGGGFRGSINDALLPEGWQAMWQSVSHLKKIEVVVSSPLQRCAAFARAYADAQQLPLVLEAGFKELHFGRWEGLSAAQLMESSAAELTAFWENPFEFTPPEGEPLLDFTQRVERALTALFTRYQSQNVLLVSHGGVIRYLLATARKMLPQLLHIEVPYSSLHRIDYQTVHNQLLGCEVKHVHI